MRDKKSLGYFISGRRKVMGLTQEELGNKIGVSKSAIAKWETNGGLPDRNNLKKLSEIMNVSVDELYRVIKQADAKDIDLQLNITPDVIAALESYGYKVIRPDVRDKAHDKEVNQHGND
jgi:transcriptional regulator with XRE-family HTH domain